MKILKTLFILICLVFLGYLLLPTPGFPNPPPNSPQSNEPADTETTLRRAYFTDYTRAEVLNWYKTQMSHSTIMGIPLPTYLLNYPPEDAQTIIRDQTRSTFLEEVVHPVRESVYVNGFEPTNPKDAVIIDGRHFRQKIIIRYVPSSIYIRLFAFAGIVAFSVILYKSWKKTIADLMKEKVRIF